MKKGSMILNRSMTTQAGKLTSKTGSRLLSVFLGSVQDGDDPDPESRMHSLGWRQMAVFEASVRISIVHSSTHTEDLDWRLVFSCLGAIDAVEASLRFAYKLIADEIERSEPGTPAPFLNTLTVGTMQIGPIGEDGTPHNGRGPAFFGWKHGDVSIDDHLETLRDEAERRSL